MTRVFKDAAHDQNESILLETQLAALLGPLDYKEGCTAVPIVLVFLRVFSHTRKRTSQSEVDEQMVPGLNLWTSVIKRLGTISTCKEAETGEERGLFFSLLNDP